MEVKLAYGMSVKVWHAINDPHYYHREDGPAVIWDDGDACWYYHNKRYKSYEEMPLNLYLAYCKWEYNKQ